MAIEDTVKNGKQFVKAAVQNQLKGIENDLLVGFDESDYMVLGLINELSNDPDAAIKPDPIGPAGVVPTYYKVSTKIALSEFEERLLKDSGLTLGMNSWDGGSNKADLVIRAKNREYRIFVNMHE